MIGPDNESRPSTEEDARWIPQRRLNDAVEMARVLGTEVKVTFEENGKAHYKIQPKETVVFDHKSRTQPNGKPPVRRK